ncbi:signal peptidase I [Paenibacillus mendelii]|uniref:Signal peptidase I n=1 Tax=Paenibacillus mendelii TaxID=206163 RepID=A0ABV6JHV9_9BACL|nr:signal peptidase I [Paenibacillus mendelii]MCQ6557940.1 signal peptidase I [Paenibacillus mendelii]
MDQQGRKDEPKNHSELTIETDPQTEGGDLPEKQGGPAKPGGGKAQKEVFEWVKALAIAALLVFVIRWLLFAPFIVDGPSMEPNFYTGERLIVNKLLFDFRDPKHGEVIVFEVPEEGRDFIKRVIGVPGDKVKYEGDNLYINGKKVEEPYLKESIEAAKARGEIFNSGGYDKNFPNAKVQSDVVPEGMVLAFGDNRRNSRDGRDIGYVPFDRIIGRADVIFWPLNQVKLVKHG